VVEGGPADQAGFRGDRSTNDTTSYQGGGDLVIAIDGQPVITYGDFIGYLIKNKSPNDTVVLRILRDGQEMDLQLRLGKRPSP
jgi:S1-C subfamily serine protease